MNWPRNAAPPRPVQVPANVRPLEPIDASTWQDAPLPERQWLVSDLVPWRNVTMLSGDGGVGKTLLALQLAVAAVLGRDFLGQPVRRAKVLAVLCEDEEDEVQRRLADVLRGFDADFGDLEGGLQILPRVGADNALMTFPSAFEPGEVTAFASNTINFCIDSGITLLILDSLHDFFPGNENSRPQARRFINELRSAAIEMDGAVLLTAHPSLSGRNTGTGEAGSTAWNNAVRSRLYLTRPDGEGHSDNERVLTTKKANYATGGGSIPILWTDGAFQRTDGGHWLDKTARANLDDERFLHLLDKIEGQGLYASPKPRASNYAPTLFKKRGMTKKAAEAAMHRLLDAGDLHVTSGKDKSRHWVEMLKRK